MSRLCLLWLVTVYTFKNSGFVFEPSDTEQEIQFVGCNIYNIIWGQSQRFKTKCTPCQVMHNIGVCMSSWWCRKIYAQQGQPCTLNRVPRYGLNQQVPQNHPVGICWKEFSSADELERVSRSLPIDSEELERGRLITDGAGPRGLLLVHLQEEDCVETLQVGTSQNPTGHTESHLHQLQNKKRTREESCSKGQIKCVCKTWIRGSTMRGAMPQKCTHWTDKRHPKSRGCYFTLWIKS